MKIYSLTGLLKITIFKENKMKHKLNKILVVCLILSSLIVSQAVSADSSYSIIDLGTLGGAYSYANAINENGQIVGYSETDSGYVHAFLWENGVMTDLGTLGGCCSSARVINERGQIAGISQTATDGYHPFLWYKGEMIDLGTLGGTLSPEASDINEQGQVVGLSFIDESQGLYAHAFLWENGNLIDLGTLGGSGSNAWGINEAGQIFGHGLTASGESHSFFWDKGIMTDLGTLGSSNYTFARDINKRGQVVGSSGSSAFIWENGVMTDLGTLGGCCSSATAINESGQIVGTSNTTSGRSIFLWKNGEMIDLGDLGLATQVIAINENGKIVGSGRIRNDIGRPVPRVYVWEKGVWTDIGTLGGYSSTADDINNRGQIVGASQTTSGESHATLWTK